ncbi:MAG TPA: type II toxin-antitoxin system RelE/ParE family toxin [Pararhizobium sp.]|nr:type II toxin-antitoxin system RelE/ParE family toxin [Pararhizobium sp.]
MKVVFLPSSDEDVRWFTRYYRSVFPGGRGKARRRMAEVLAILADNPQIGRTADDTGQRELPITNTPFALIYRVTADRIEILRLWDGRANPDRLQAPDKEQDL